MNKLIFFLTLLLAFASCKGPGSGPLVKDSFKEDKNVHDMDPKNHMGQVTTEKENVVIEPCDGCVTIAKLLADKKSFSGKVVKVKGKVIKFNPAIMGKNWIHIQDGTEFEGGFDLTVTTDIQTAVGETITLEGTIGLDKDFGYGYVYNVLMEDAKLAL